MDSMKYFCTYGALKDFKKIWKIGGRDGAVVWSFVCSFNLFFVFVLQDQTSDNDENETIDRQRRSSKSSIRQFQLHWSQTRQL